MSNVVFTFKGGKLIDNFETLGAVTTKSFTVPTGKRWMPLGIMYVERDANATLDIALYNDLDKLLLQLITQLAAGVTNVSYPFNAVDDPTIAAFQALKGMTLKAEWYVKVTWGAAQTTPEVSFPVLEIDET